MASDNPRWPFTFSVVGESLYSNGLPVTDENGDPVTSTPAVSVALYDADESEPLYDSDGKPVMEERTLIPWGYRTSTGGMKTSGDVIVADYKISCPMLLTEIPTGTVLEMTDYVHSFRAKVIKMTTFNWGTNLWIDNIKN